MDIFEQKNCKPMLLSEESEPFDSDDYLFEIKFDGIRCILYLDEKGTEIRNKRNLRLNATYPELKNIHKQVKKRCILDGELVVMKDGKPDFQAVQKRSLMSNKSKIELAAKMLPVSFMAYDILYVEKKQVTDLPLANRKKLLHKTVKENEFLSISPYMEKNGVQLYDFTVKHDLEGIVAKKKDSKYYFDKRSKDWIKVKYMQDEDFVICGYILKMPVASIILGIYQDGVLINQGHVSVGMSREEFKKIQACNPFPQSFYAHFPNDVETIWIEPKLVCTVEYMRRTPNGGLRQPVFKSIRIDKQPSECVLK